MQTPMNLQRLRLRFSKQRDLRFIGHRDLVRTFERLFRRAGLKLQMSQGFHPKPRLSFPSALAVGIEGACEVMELGLMDSRSVDELFAVLRSHCPDGLEFLSAEIVPQGTPKASVHRVVVELLVPRERRREAEQRMNQWLRQPSYPVVWPHRHHPVDIRPLVEGLEIVDGVLRMTLRITNEGSARPREVLDALGLADLEQVGCCLKRTAVELQS